MSRTVVARSFVAAPTVGLALVMNACGADAELREVLEPAPPGLSAVPQWLTFTCVEPGCVDTLSARVTVDGTRDLAIKRIVLSEDDRPDFTVVSAEQPPFTLAPTTTFDIDVTYRPTGDPRLGDVDLLVTYTDASASEEDPERLPPGELVIPLVRRQIGEPRLVAEPEAIVFGPVRVGEEVAAPLTVRNMGFGNAGLVIESIEVEEPDEVRVENLPPQALLPDEAWNIQVIFAPATERYIEGSVTVQPVGALELPVVVPFVGTSIPRPRVELTPKDGIDFGEIPIAGTAEAKLTIKNGGAERLVLRSIRLDPPPTRAGVTLTGPGIAATATVAPLASVDIELDFEARERGEVETEIVIETNDPTASMLRVPLEALITKPELRVEPAELDFGAVPQGWSVVRPIEISNVGFGELVISNITLILGSSTQFTVQQMPTLPIRLRHEQRVGLEVEFRSETEASFAATMALDSNDADNPFVEVSIAGEGASCERGCPIANGTPGCAGGVCSVQSCDENWYDADGQAATGCECAEIDRDPGAFCADAVRIIGLDDDGDRATFRGILPLEGDEDVIRFFAEDGFQLLGDSYDVRVSLESTDPSVRMCVYRYSTGRPLNECFFANESCPTDRSYRRDGSGFRDDAADYIIRVFREEDAPATCTPYTLFIRNGD